LRRQQARGAGGYDGQRDRAQQPAAIVIDCFGVAAAHHGGSPRFDRCVRPCLRAANTYAGAAEIARYAL
jgi:hypothetical protein